MYHGPRFLLMVNHSYRTYQTTKLLTVNYQLFLPNNH